MIRTLAAALATTTYIAALATPAAAQTREFNIPAGSLRSALDTYARQSGRQVIYGADVRSARSPGVRGARTVDDALTAILAGTGFVVKQDRSGALAIVKGGNGQSVAAEPLSSEREEDISDNGEEIVVTGTNIRGNSPASPVLAITRDYIRQTGRATTAEVLATLPQAFNGGQNAGVRGGGGSDLTGASSPNLRGLGSASTLTLFNGHRLAPNGFQGGADISAIPLAAIDRIEVVTDGASAVYGADAVAGVVNVILRKDFDGAETTGFVGFSNYGDGLQRQLSQTVGKQWNSGSILAAYEYNKTDPILSAKRPFASAVSTYENYMLPSIRRHSGYAQLQQKLGETLSLTIDGLYSNRHSQYNRSFPTFTQTQRLSIEQWAISPSLELQVGGNWSVALAGTVSRDDTTNIDQNINYPGAVRAAATVSDFRNTYYSAQLQANGSLFALGNRDVKLAAGGGYNHFDFSLAQAPSNLLGVSASRESYFGYAELFVPVLDRDGRGLLDFTVAARYEDFSDFGDTFNPKIGFIFRPSADLTVRGTWGTAFRAPEIYKLYTPAYTYALTLATFGAPPRNGKTIFLFNSGPNPDLGPERATTWSLSADFAPRAIPGLKLTLSPYLIKYRDRIDYPAANIVDVFINPQNYPSSVIFDPTPAQVADIIARGVALSNGTGSAIDPTNVAFLYNGAVTNVTKVNTWGIDGDINYAFESGAAKINLFAAGSYIHQRQPITIGQPLTTVSGTIFHPPSFRGRGGASIDAGMLFGSAVVNYTGSLRNNVSRTQSRVKSYATFDLQIGVRPGFSSGLELAFAVQNLFDKDPPFLAADSTNPLAVGFDATNASGMGRFYSIRATKRW